MQISSLRALAITVIGLAFAWLSLAARTGAQNCGFTGSCTTTYAEEVDVSGSDPALQPLLDDYTFGTDIVTFVDQVEADVGDVLLGSYGISVGTTVLSQVGIGDPESPDFIVLHTDYLQTTTAHFALSDPPGDASTATSTTAFQSVVEVADSDPALQPVLSAYTFGTDIDEFVNQLEADLSQQLLGSYGISVETTILNQFGIGNPGSPDFIILHTDYLETTMASFALHRSIVPEPTALAVALSAAAICAAFARNPRSRYVRRG